ncbi:MAG: hypothetical protein ACRD52_18410 [Candidatus Acidiferrales bacterium]
MIEKFHEKFPNVPVTKWAVCKLVKKFHETGSVLDFKKVKKSYNEDDAATLLVLQSVRENPIMSLRKRAMQLQVVQKSTMQEILKQNKIFPYKPHYNQTLEEGDEGKRLDFCLWVGSKIAGGNRIFHKLIMFSDESTFSTNGTVASQHVRYWNDVNPMFRIPTRRQYFKKVNVWCAVSYYGIIGPYFFDDTCNRNSYLNMLNNFFSDHLEQLPLDYRNSMYFQQDGCPAHYAREVKEWLDLKFRQKWIGRNGPVLWPPRSPDITLADMFLWGRLKQLTYANALPNDKDILKQRIVQAVEAISLEEVRRSYDYLRAQLEKCVQCGGAVFE